MCKKLFLLSCSLILISMLSACSTFTTITSQPEGAVVTLNGEEIGTTPFSYNVSTRFGLFNLYSFEFTKNGYMNGKQDFRENSLFDGASSCIPQNIDVKLQKGYNSPKPEEPAETK